MNDLEYDDEEKEIDPVFGGTFDYGKFFWTFEFYLPNTALTVNADGTVLLSCAEAVIDITDEDDKVHTWDGFAKVKRWFCKEQGTHYVSVKIFRDGKWLDAASLTKEKDWD